METVKIDKIFYAIKSRLLCNNRNKRDEDESPIILAQMDTHKDTRQRSAIHIGCTVNIVKKEDRQSGRRLRDTVQETLTNSSFHSHGIKVRLKDRRAGVQEIITVTQEKSE